jgi:hypothetical protein
MVLERPALASPTSGFWRDLSLTHAASRLVAFVRRYRRRR